MQKIHDEQITKISPAVPCSPHWPVGCLLPLPHPAPDPSQPALVFHSRYRHLMFHSFISLQLLHYNLSFMREGPDVCLFMAEFQSLERGLVCGAYSTSIGEIESLQSSSYVHPQYIKQMNEVFQLV